MNTLLGSNLLDIFKIGLGSEPWQEFIDRYEEKYNNVQIDGFDFAPLSLNYTWQQLLASTGASTLPAYVDPESPGYEEALRSAKAMTGNIPTQKKYYRLNRVALQERLQLLQMLGNAAITPEMQSAFLSLIDESTDGLITSYYNALTHQRMQIVSTGQFVINSTNNPRGLNGITINFNVPSANADTLTGTARWFTASDYSTEGSASDPIDYIKKRVRDIRNKFHYNGPLQLEMAQELFDALLTHSKVQERIGLALNPSAASTAIAKEYAQNMPDDSIRQMFSRLCGITIVPRDSYAYVAAPGTNSDGVADLVTTRVENFKKENIAFIPTGKIGSIQGVQPLATGYDADKVGYFNGGRLLMTQYAIPRTHSVYVESEAAQLCVPNQPQYMFISTVTA